MTKDEYLEFSAKFFEQCVEISKRKNSDYTGNTQDPFANFKSVEQLGIKTEVGFLTRMNDKMMRLASFVQNGTLQVKDESVTDTLNDLANYCALFAGYLKSKSLEEKSEPEYNGMVDFIMCSSPRPNAFDARISQEKLKQILK
jgi:hypothetical protein